MKSRKLIRGEKRMQRESYSQQNVRQWKEVFWYLKSERNLNENVVSLSS